MDRTHQQGLGAVIIALALALGQLPSLISIITNPAVSVFDQSISIVLVIGASSLLYLGISQYRHPEEFENGSTGHEFRPIATVIIAAGLFGIGALLYVIAS